jgi:hypothetical protein
MLGGSRTLGIRNQIAEDDKVETVCRAGKRIQLVTNTPWWVNAPYLCFIPF